MQSMVQGKHILNGVRKWKQKCHFRVNHPLKVSLNRTYGLKWAFALPFQLEYKHTVQIVSDLWLSLLASCAGFVYTCCKHTAKHTKCTSQGIEISDRREHPGACWDVPMWNSTRDYEAFGPPPLSAVARTAPSTPKTSGSLNGLNLLPGLQQPSGHIHTKSRIVTLTQEKLRCGLSF